MDHVPTDGCDVALDAPLDGDIAADGEHAFRLFLDDNGLPNDVDLLLGSVVNYDGCLVVTGRDLGMGVKGEAEEVQRYQEKEDF